MRIDHRRFNVRVAEVLLDLPDVNAVEQQMRGKAMTLCTETGLWIFASRAAALTAFWITESLR
jgi:hypothetical protein